MYVAERELAHTLIRKDRTSMNIYAPNDTDEFINELREWCKNNPFDISEYGLTTGIQTGSMNSFYGRKHTEESKLKISKSKKGKSVNKGRKCPWAKDSLKFIQHRAFGRFLITDPTNKTFEITNLKLFCSDKNLSYTSMSSLANGKYPCNRYKGYMCRKIGYIKIKS